MKIKVTNQDIGQGWPRDAQQCPVALALRREFPDKTIAVRYSHIQIGDARYPVPKRVYNFLWDFDFKLPVMPFEFDLNED